MRVGITGATGLIGTKLAARLLARGDRVVAFSRDPQRAAKKLPTGVEARGLDAIGAEVCSTLDAVVNLAGESVAARRWSDEQKRVIRESRLSMTRTVVDALAAASTRAGVLVNASAVGYYGARGDEEVTEESAAGSDFLANVCVAWEHEAERASALGVRVVRARIGVVLGEDGGALQKMLLPFKCFVGGPVGDGRQYLSWVHVDDVVGMLVHAIDHTQLRGAMNVTAPTPQRFETFARALGDVLRRPSWLPVPSFALRLVVGEMADVLVTGQRAVPAVATSTGYVFEYASLEHALRAVLKAG